MIATGATARLISVLVSLPLTTALPQQGYAIHNNLQSVLGSPIVSGDVSRDGQPIPGASRFVFCDDSFEDDLFQVEYLAITPNPPNIGDFWRFEMGGMFTKDLPPHSNVHVLGRINGTDPDLPPLDITSDFCRIADTVTQKNEVVCPPKKGNAVIESLEYVPWAYPDATYNFTIDLFTPHGERVFCLHTEVWMESPHR